MEGSRHSFLRHADLGSSLENAISFDHEEFRLYDLEMRKSEAKNLTSDPKKAIKTSGNTDYLLIPLCEECLLGGITVRGTLSGPTISSPYDIKLLHNYIFAKLIAVWFIDRRDATTFAISTGSPSR